MPRAPRPGRAAGASAARPATVEPVTSITSAPTTLADDMSHRMRSYALQMSVRLACFLGAVALDHWTRWVLVVAAVVLPYTAVLGANAAGDRRGAPGSFVTAPALPPAPAPGGPPLR